jgi:hypothetical protein
MQKDDRNPARDHELGMDRLGMDRPIPRRDGKFWRTAATPVGPRETYDLAVVGSGLRGLAAAYFYRAKNPAAPIRLLIRPVARCKNFRQVEATLSSSGGSNE